MNNKKTFSCNSLHNALYLAPDELRHCCKRFYVNGKMKGDVKIFSVNNSKDVNSNNILQAKKNYMKILIQIKKPHAPAVHIL